MPLPGLRRAFVVGLVLLALGAGLASTHATASAQAPPGGTITTQLQPGWNMIGWLGPDTTAAELFDAIPVLNFIVAWDGGAQRYRWVWRASLGLQALPWIQGGRGLALHIRGEAAVEWTRPAAEGVVLLPLRAGNNLVTWGGLDGTPIEEALDWLGDAVVGASRWNADTGESERYRPGAPPSANTLRTLNHGDALWVQLSEDASWWQSATAETEFEFEEPLHPETESALRGEVAGVLAFFYENYGLEPVDLLVTTVRDLSTGANAWVGEITVGGQVYNLPEPDFPIAHEYFHVLQFHWAQGPANFFELPNWLIEGTAVYAEDVYHRERLGWTGGGIRAHWWQRATGSSVESLPLGHWVFDHGWQGDEAVYVGYYVGALATDWLVRRAAALSTGTPFAPLEPPEMVAGPDHNAHLEFFRLLPASASWEEAFEAAFGIAVDDFYEAFEEYRIALGAEYLPHLADDRDEPLLLFLGEIPTDTRTLLREQFETARELFRDRFASGPVDYTVFVAADQSRTVDYTVLEAADQQWTKVMRAHFGGTREGIFTHGICKVDIPGAFLFLALANCEEERLADSLGGYHFDTALSLVLPAERFIQVLPGYEPPGPHWLQVATRGYAVSAYQDSVGIETLDEARRALAQLARKMAEPLSSLTALPEPGARPDETAEALSFLAGDWLVGRAGESAIFEYYRLLESTDSWEEAFEAAFGITINDFYREFEEYRAAVAPPGAPGDPDGPTLVLLGEMSAEIEAALRADFEALQVFFNERFGAEPVDYTAYVATTRPVAEANRAVLGWVSRDICSWGTRDGDFAMTLSRCAGSIAETLGEFHFGRVVRRVAPPDSFGPVFPEWESLGPYWLWVAASSYMKHALLRSVESGLYPGFGSSRSLDASRTEHPLSSFEQWSASYLTPGVDLKALSFVAADRLVQRAGEPALLEYYRLLGSSATWQEAFEGAFGIAIDDFYAAFAAYRTAGFER